ncbi:hypothetical protein K0M31_007893 [Melipona bicolor]|uniref:OAR domain-containing protein n=1 Tax=Melipona bicolor TaxID=60889 RepID=A0AA40KW57_9HYME|nr:hypothetical protein K0M31_007893 [Melipona bicolor]
MAAAVAVNVGQDRLSKITSTPRLIRRLLAVTGAIGKFIHQAYEPSRQRVGSRIPLRESLSNEIPKSFLIHKRSPRVFEQVLSQATVFLRVGTLCSGRSDPEPSVLPYGCLTVTQERRVWFKNRRAKWRKQTRNANTAADAVDFKPGFGASLNSFIGQPFADPDALYSSYSTYNNWAAKVPSPLSSKSFPWVNTLGSVVPTASHHHHHTQVSPVNCFNAAATSVAGNHMGGMSVSVGQAATSMLPGMGSGLGVAGSPVAATGAACPYAAPAAPHHPYGPPVYTPHHRTAAAPESCTVMTSSSIASLRLKARQHSSGYSSLSGNSFSMDSTPVSAAGSPVGSRAPSVGGGGPLSACQYALTTAGEANPHSPSSAEAHVNATARAQV